MRTKRKAAWTSAKWTTRKEKYAHTHLNLKMINGGWDIQRTLKNESVSTWAKLPAVRNGSPCTSRKELQKSRYMIPSARRLRWRPLIGICLPRCMAMTMFMAEGTTFANLSSIFRAFGGRTKKIHEKKRLKPDHSIFL